QHRRIPHSFRGCGDVGISAMGFRAGRAWAAIFAADVVGVRSRLFDEGAARIDTAAGGVAFCRCPGWLEGTPGDFPRTGIGRLFRDRTVLVRRRHVALSVVASL